MVRTATRAATRGSMPMSQAGSLPLSRYFLQSDGICIVFMPHDVQERIIRCFFVYMYGSAKQLPEIRRNIHTYFNGVYIVTSVV